MRIEISAGTARKLKEFDKKKLGGGHGYEYIIRKAVETAMEERVVVPLKPSEKEVLECIKERTTSAGILRCLNGKGRRYVYFRVGTKADKIYIQREDGLARWEERTE